MRGADTLVAMPRLPRRPALLASLLTALAIVTACAACGGRTEGSSKQVRIAAAADLARAFEEVAAAFEKETGIKAVMTFGSTGLLSKQIIEGAPYDLFAAANISYVEKVVAAGVCDKASQALYARGRIVLWSPGEVPARLEDLVDPRWKKIALANPDHAPYGMAAKQALVQVGVWDQLVASNRLVFGENVQQTMQYAKSGNVDVAVVALSLAVVADGGASTQIDSALHEPLDQALTVCGKGAGATSGARFAAYVASPAGREIMTRYGFVLPGERPATPAGK